MSYDLKEINIRTVRDPNEFCAECEDIYNSRICEAVDRIIANMEKSPVVLLSGPSGSGKTTTARKISEELDRRGFYTHYVSLDDYFKTVGEGTPRTPEGDYDLESPLCLDMDLLNQHFQSLSEGKRIFVPHYEFARQMRSADPSKSIKLKENELCIFEGIHALNEAITSAHPEAFRLYISAGSDVEFEGKTVFKRTWFRLVRRAVRDFNFRGYGVADTLAMWGNVRRGEKLYISPFKDTADFQFDSSMMCEIPVLNSIATELFCDIPEGIDRFEELKEVLPALQLFGRIDESNVPEDSLLREFIGGGIYD